MGHWHDQWITSFLKQEISEGQPWGLKYSLNLNLILTNNMYVKHTDVLLSENLSLCAFHSVVREEKYTYLTWIACHSRYIHSAVGKENIIFVCFCSVMSAGQRMYFKVYYVKKIMITFFY